MTSRATTVLLVDDDPAMLRLLTAWLEAAGFEVSMARDGRQAQACIECNCPAILLADWEMPGLDGLQLCEWVRQQPLPSYVYTIVLTVRSAAADIVRALEAGADDVLKKPVHRDELVARMRAGTRVMELQRRLSQLANTDGLTGLATRRTLYEAMHRELPRSRRHRVPTSCVMIDIDFFKRINDLHGHPAGDEVLRQFGRLLAASVRASDLISRYGGEEFCTLLPETTEGQAVLWAERLRKETAALRIQIGETTLPITASFGVAQCLADTQTPEQLVDMADQALLVAKRTGRDRVLAFGSLNQANLLAEGGGDSAAMLRDVPARVVMTSLVAPLEQDDTVGSASNYFLRFRIGSAPVVDQAGQLVGILSEKDVMAIMLGRDWRELPIKAVMKRNVVCYDEETPALTIYEFLCRAAIRGAVIVRQGRPTGLITRGSLLRYFMNSLAVQGGGDFEMDLVAAQLSARVQAERPRDRIGQTVLVLQDEVSDLESRLREPGYDLVPEVVGGASRIQELATDLLALSRYANEDQRRVPAPANMS